MSKIPLPATPYKGLVPYSEEDAPFFFGREAEREIITANLMASRLTLLYGASGVGKSSVLRAGVVQHLRQLTQQSLAKRGTPRFAVVVFSSWRDDPLAGLVDRVKDSVAQALNVQTLEPVPLSRILAQTLQAWTERVGGDLLIILDQFEEYFLYHPQEDGEGTFAVEFPRAVNRSDLCASFLISIREDSLAKLDRFKGRIPFLFDNYLRIEHLDREAARAAIEKPIERYNHLHAVDGQQVSIEPELVEAVLEQVKIGQVVLGEAGRGVAKVKTEGARIETPYLQLVMTRLWDEEMRAGSYVLRLETLMDLKGAEGIVRKHLEDSMSKLTENEKDAAARVFHYLVTPSGTKIAQSVLDLAEYAKLPQAQLEPMLEKLSRGDTRILRPVAPPPDQPNATRYEIFHDVLAPAILEWRRRYVERQVQEQIRREEQERREQERVEAARKLRARRLYWILASLFTLLTLLSFLSSYVLKQRNDAIEAQKKAEIEQEKAKNAEKLAQQGLERILDSIKLKQAALSGDQKAIDAALNSNLGNNQIVFRASAKPYGYSNKQGKPVYLFQIFPEKDSIPGGPKSIAFITYKMDHPSFRNSLLVAGPDRDFTASYDGWGCLRQVIAVIEYTDPDKAPAIASFDMCRALGWK